MSKELQVLNNNLVMWDDNGQIEEIRKLFAPTLTEMEFKFFIGLGKASGLNPFTREIWVVKYDKNAPAQVFIGRDGYRKAAQSHAEYDYHQSDAVYENDKFEVKNGEVTHQYTMKNRGLLIGAYCIAKRHKSSRPIYVFAELKEYSTGRSLWRDKPATMIKKVAESQCLRACFQDLLGGTYAEEEMNHSVSSNDVKTINKSEDLINKIKSTKGQIIEGNAIYNEENAEISNKEQIDEINALLTVKCFDKDRLKSAMTHYKIDYLEQLTINQANDFIARLNKEDDK